MLEWILRSRGVSHIFHYVDDFIVVGEPHSSVCADALATTLQTYSFLGVRAYCSRENVKGLLHPHRAGNWSRHSPHAALPPYQQAIKADRDSTSLETMECCTKHELLSLVGSLQHASKVVKGSQATHLCVGLLIYRWPIDIWRLTSASNANFSRTSSGGFKWPLPGMVLRS